MRRRCYNPREPQFKDWGGRGIRVCDEWRGNFEAFLRDVGDRPGPEFQLDRINNDGNYEPGNVRWATRTEQSRNRRCSRRLTVSGETLTLREWAERTGINERTLRHRAFRLGWTDERAVCTPVARTTEKG
jgi:hypothetical protein